MRNVATDFLVTNEVLSSLAAKKLFFPLHSNTLCKGGGSNTFEGKRPLGRPRRRWEDGIRMDLREIGLGGVDWIRLAQGRDRWRAVVSAVMNLRVLAPQS
jgi:hypothetical protein